MKKKLLIGAAVAAALVLIAGMTLYFYSVRPLEILGENLPANTREYTLADGKNVTFTDILTDVSQLKKLEKLDLGAFLVEAREEKQLREAFPGVELKYQTYVSLYGLKLEPETERVDLSGKELTSLDELRAAIPYLKEVKTILSSDFVIPREELEGLRKQFPEIDFEFVSSVGAFGDTVRDDVTALDLRGKNASFDDLKRDLALLPELKELDLRGTALSKDEKMQLVKAFPGIDFRWEVELAGNSYDSYTEDLDLSGKKNVTPDLMRSAAPLFPKLTRLDMSDCGASNEEMASLRKDLPDVKVVWRIHMGRWSLKTDAVAFSVLIYDYSHTRLTSADIEVLKYCTDLQALDLGHQAIRDISVIGDYLTELRILVLVDNQVSDLTPVAKLKHLHYIELFVNSHLLTDISPLASCKELVDVNVSYLYNVTDFSPLFDLPLLERLWMEHTQVHGEQLQYILEHYPNATIITQGTGSIDNGWRTHERYYAAWGLNGMFHDPNCRALREEFSKYDQAD